MIDLTDILLAIIALFTYLNWIEHSNRVLILKIKYGKCKRKVINFIFKRK